LDASTGSSIPVYLMVQILRMSYLAGFQYEVARSEP